MGKKDFSNLNDALWIFENAPLELGRMTENFKKVLFKEQNAALFGETLPTIDDISLFTISAFSWGTKNGIRIERARRKKINVYDYDCLLDKIYSKYHSGKTFSKAMGFSYNRYTNLMNCIEFWNQQEIQKAAELLQISDYEIDNCFFKEANKK